MATSSKFDLSSVSPDRPVYTTGQRGSHLASQFDRSGSFRESMENPILPSLPNLTRSSCIVAQGDVVNFFQCLRFDPKVVASEHKCSRQGDFRRHLNIALGISGDDSPTVPSKGKILPEDFKRVKAILRESIVKARERMKTFNEALSVLNKFFPSIQSRKKSSTALLSSDRSVLGPSLTKMGIQNHAINSGSEIEPTKLEERTKNAVPSKRTRTSLVDVRSNALVRASAALDRDREILHLANAGAIQGDGVDGWEKTKLKKKRSGIKSDGSPIAVPIKPSDGHRESKQGMQQRLVSDNRSRLSCDSHGFRPGVANDAVGVAKSDNLSQPTGMIVRPSLPRTDPENDSHLNDRRERPVSLDKERGNFRAVNKSNVVEDFNSASPTSTAKMNAIIRAPRSGSGITPKLSPIVHRATTSNDWELPHCTNKPPAVGANSRKRTASARSSSPPVAQWAGQRPQKISRTARRTNLIPIISNNYESPVLDSVSDASGNEVGMGFTRRLTGNSPQQVKSKGELLSSAALSESEESGTPEIKSKDKEKKSDEIDENAEQNVQKVSLGLSSRKNKLVSADDLIDGVRKQGRSGRGFISARSLVRTGGEKLGNMGTAKQLRSARLCFDKNESKAGRPPTRKLSDRKAYARQKHATVNTSTDFLVGSDDGKEELLAAASFAINPPHAFSGEFWGQMERFFGFISDEDVTYLNQQDTKVEYAETRSSELEQFMLGGLHITPCQRLLAAIIPEEESTHTNGNVEFDGNGDIFELDGELGTDGLDHLVNINYFGRSTYNNYNKITAVAETDEADIVIMPKFSHSTNGVFEQSSMSNLACPELQYDNMQINDRLLLEVQSIGLFPQSVVDLQMEDEDIFDDINKLEEKYQAQVLKKKALQEKLLKAALETKVQQEKKFEQRAYDKLITMAYDKYMSCRRSHAAGGKGSSNKMAKQAALAFVKRILEYCHRFEDTGKSCFSDQLYRDMFLSGLNYGQAADAHSDESVKLYANNSTQSFDARVSASFGSQPSPRNSRLSMNGESYDPNSLDMLHPVNHLSEQTNGKEDGWLSRGRKRELLLDVGNAGNSSILTGIGGSLSNSTKGKRSERDREGKGHNRGAFSINGTNKIGRPSSSNAKGERKSKTKPKQKITQLSVSVNGLLGKMSEQPKPASVSESKSREMAKDGNAKEKDGLTMDVLDAEAIDLSSLPEIDEEQDLGSWLNIDDDGLPDHGDFMGLEIPMDDLSDLNMMV